MAVIVNTSYDAKFNLPMPIGRLNPTPNDSSEIWTTLALAQNYATSGATAYVGQIIYVQETQKHYTISNTAGTLLEIAEGPLSSIIRGYYIDGDFYQNANKTNKITGDVQKFYVDMNSTEPAHTGNYEVYTYIDASVKYRKTVNIPDATDQIKGIVKLYTSYGQNTDGTMTQKAISDLVGAVKLAIDPNDSECLILELPF